MTLSVVVCSDTPTRISITNSRKHQSLAVAFLSDTLNNFGCPHSFNVGFAWFLLSSKRPTEISCSALILVGSQ